LIHPRRSDDRLRRDRSNADLPQRLTRDSKDAARIEWGDTLNSPALVEANRLMRFNVVVANPPFSLDLTSTS
jgi:hypothetical protein